MKVIREGKKIVGSMMVDCKKCDARLLIVAKDLRPNRQETSVNPSYYFDCPCCGRSQLIKHAHLSEDIVFDLTHPQK